MFKPKKEVVKVEAVKEEPKSEPVAQEYSIGDIIPIHEIVGWNVIKGFDNDNLPIVVTTEKRWEAELLSIALRE